MDPGRIGEPVVGMDEVKLLAACQHACNDAEVVDFIMQVAGIASCKAHAAQVVKALHVIEVGINVVAEPVIVVG